MPTAIREIAFELDLGKDNIIDIFEALGGAKLGKWELMCDAVNCDGLHPN